MKMKYGGPEGGRPMMGKRTALKKGKAVMTPGEQGRRYLVGARGHIANQNRESGSFSISNKVTRQVSHRQERNPSRKTRRELNPFG